MLELIHPACIHSFHELSIKGKKWKYRGEGNANLVLALPQERIILRFHKCHRDAVFTSITQEEDEERVRREALFCSTVMVPLLGTAYIQPPIPALIDPSEITQLNEELSSQRPVFRHHKMVKCGCVNIYPDYALLPERLYFELITSIDFPINENILNTNNALDLNITLDLLCSNHDQRINKSDKRDVDSENKCNRVKEVVKISTPLCEDEKQECLNDHTPLLTVCNNRISPVIRNVSKDNFSTACLSYQNIFLNLLESTPTFCVEIKPKQGWIPPVDRRYPKCTFCLNQYLKLANRAVKVLSEYCPLDLFSGDPSRMKKSIEALLNTPQNNLKIFKDGLLVYSDDSSTDIINVLQQWLEPDKLNTSIDSKRVIEKFTSLILHALTSDLLNEESYPKVEEPSTPCLSPDVTDRVPTVDLSGIHPQCNWASQPLRKNCILDRILRIQKLEQTGSDNIYRMYKMLVKTEGDYDYVRRLQDPGTKNLSFDNVQRYLLATTAKDCSILITFQLIPQLNPIMPLSYRRHVAQDPDGANYIWNIGVSDLDPKPLSCIEKHRKRDCEVISACSALFCQL